MDQDKLNQAKSLISSASSVIVLLPPTPDADSLNAAISLHLSLKQAGKTSVLGCSSDVSTITPAPLGVKELQKAIGNQKLVISFDYLEDKVDLVSYDLDESGKRFNLVITPKEGATPLDPKSVQYAYTGASADLVITFAINSLEELGKLYSDEKAFLDQAPIININSSRPSTFAKLNLAATGVSISELIGQLLKSAGLNPTADGATNLYRQLLASTDNFQSPTITADTFDLAAFLMRHQASRAASAPVFFKETDQARSTVIPGQTSIPTPPSRPLNAPFNPRPAITNANQAPKSVPSDWQKPKIFRATPATPQSTELK